VFDGYAHGAELPVAADAISFCMGFGDATNLGAAERIVRGAGERFQNCGPSAKPRCNGKGEANLRSYQTITISN
jgi:hydrogenase/urease accessory protein HupE